ncbi:hypothetical protein AGMMS49941_12140 [Deferribacterales bacterium]|nr:hypothetical protein AGMMS49941_12140 [Deferribacterales bacterium]
MRIKSCPNWALLALTIALQLGIIAYYNTQKTSIFKDEILAFWAANGIASSELSLFDTWQIGSYYLEYLSAQTSEMNLSYLFNLAFSHSLQTIQEWTPTFYHIQLHLVSSLFPDTFSLWLGVAVNMFWFVGVCIVLWRLSALLLPDKLLAILPVLLYGFSHIAIITVTYVKQYCVVAFFCTALVYLAVYLTKQAKVSGRYYIALGAVFFLGAYSHLYFIIWCASVAGLILIYLLKAKRFSEIKRCIVTALVSAGLFLLAYPQIFSVISVGRTKSMFMPHLLGYIRDINTSFLAGTLPVLAFAVVAMFILAVHKRRLSDLQLLGCLFLAVCCYILTISYFGTPWHGVRYIFPIMPVVSLFVISALFIASEGIILPRNLLAGCLFVLTLIVAIGKEKPFIDIPDAGASANGYYNVPCIAFIGNDEMGIHRTIHHIMKFDSGIIFKLDQQNWDKNYEKLASAIKEANSDRLVIFNIPAPHENFDALIEQFVLKQGYTSDTPLGNHLYLFSR